MMPFMALAPLVFSQCGKQFFTIIQILREINYIAMCWQNQAFYNWIFVNLCYFFGSHSEFWHSSKFEIFAFRHCGLTTPSLVHSDDMLLLHTQFYFFHFYNIYFQLKESSFTFEKGFSSWQHWILVQIVINIKSTHFHIIRFFRTMSGLVPKVIGLMTFDI